VEKWATSDGGIGVQLKLLIIFWRGKKVFEVHSREEEKGEEPGGVPYIYTMIRSLAERGSRQFCDPRICKLEVGKSLTPKSRGAWSWKREPSDCAVTTKERPHGDWCKIKEWGEGTPAGRGEEAQVRADAREKGGRGGDS